MENSRIAEVESKVIELQKLLKRFQWELESWGREPDNYNHLGTLDVNAKILKSTCERVIQIL